MTDKSFLLSKWKPFEIINCPVTCEDGNRIGEFMIIGVDFEERTFNVRNLDLDAYVDEVYTVHMSQINRGGIFKLKVST